MAVKSLPKARNYLTIAELAGRVGVSDKTVRRWIANGLFKDTVVVLRIGHIIRINWPEFLKHYEKD